MSETLRLLTREPLRRAMQWETSMSEQVPVFFGADIELHEIIQAIRPMGWTLRADKRAGIVIIQRDERSRAPSHCANVLPFKDRRRSC